MSLSKYNVDITGLENLLKDIVLYVEFRSDNIDSSSSIAREVKELGATISTKRNKTVTHVLFNEGTLRTSDWAKRHGIPLVGIGWIADSVLLKMCLLSTPYHIDYMEPELDRIGFKKKMTYKKYFKEMSVEEYKEQCRKKDERDKKKLKKMLNDSKNSLATPDANTERILKLSDPLKKPPTPEIVKEYQEKYEKQDKLGRYSWESDDEDDQKSAESSFKLDKTSKSSLNDNESPVNMGKVTSKRKLCDMDNIFEIDDLIIPKRKKDKDFSIILPKTVRKLSETSTSHASKSIKRPAVSMMNFAELKNHKKKKVEDSIKNISNDKSEDIKSDIYQFNESDESCTSENPLNKAKTKRRKIKVKKNLLTLYNEKGDNMKKEQNNNKLINSKVDEKSPNLITGEPDQNEEHIDCTENVSPLITNKPSVLFNSPSYFKNSSKKRSLRFKLLKQSAKKFKHSILSGIDMSNNLDSPENIFVTPDNSKNRYSKILVPDTAKTEKNGSANLTAGPLFFTPKNTKDITIPETPIDIINSFKTPMNSDCDFTDSMLNVFKSPGATRYLDNEFSDYEDSEKIDDNVIIVKNSLYDHSEYAPAPNYAKITNYLSHGFKVVTPNTLNKHLENITREKDTVLNKSSPNEMIKLDSSKSQCNDEGEVINIDEDPCSIFKLSTQSSDNILVNNKENIEDCGNIFQTTQEETSRAIKRPLSVIDTEKKVITRVRKKSKRIRDSRDDFVYTPNLKTEMSKQPKLKKSKLQNKEIVIIGLQSNDSKKLLASCKRLPSNYNFVDMVRSKEQLVVLPNDMRYNMDMLKAFILGSTLVSIDWLEQSIKNKTWLNYKSYIVEEAKLNHVNLVKTPELEKLFQDYSKMYISSFVKKIHKYKLRMIIEYCGGKVIDSFRQAGIVIGTSKANAMSVTEDWILDSVSQLQVVDPEKYLIR